MRLIDVKNIEGDEILAQSVLDINARRLLTRGINLQKSYIPRLMEKGIYSIYIEDDISEGIEINEVLCTQTRMQAKQAVAEELSRFNSSQSIDSSKIKNVVDDILNELLTNKSDISSLKDIRLQDEYTFAHSVNVCVLSILLATKLGYSKEKIRNIGTGAILHDFGKIMISPEILKKDTDLTPEELNELQYHPLYGYNIFKDNPSISSQAKVGILMHHEKIDGSGYPMNLSGDRIHYAARIIAICDAYDSITSDRKFKNALSTSEAVEHLLRNAGKQYDKAFVFEFLRHIPIFPNGTIVLLSNGLIGIVVKNNSINVTRPKVRMIYNPKTKTKYGRNYIVDLTIDYSLKILKEIRVPYNRVSSS